MLTTFCPCCAANQLYQTTSYLKFPATNVGPKYNFNEMAQTNNQWTLGNTLYMCCCMPCAVGDSMNRAMDMPWLLGCCCMPLCSARNVLRYHHRVHTTLTDETSLLWTAGYCSTELFEECFLMSLANGIVQILDQCTSGLAGLLLLPATTYIVAQIVAESQTGRAGPGYLVGYRSNVSVPVAHRSNVSVVPVAHRTDVTVPVAHEYVAPLIIKSNGEIDRGDEIELRFN